MAKGSKFAGILWVFLMICFIMAMIPLLSLRYINSKSPSPMPSLFSTSSMQSSAGDLHINSEEKLSDLKKTQHVSKGKGNAMRYNHGDDMNRKNDYHNKSTNTVHTDSHNNNNNNSVDNNDNGDDGDDDTLVPLSEIPKSPYYSFDPNIMPRSFLRNLQNSSKRIIKKWKYSYFKHYISADISNCDIITPECSLHKYLLKRTKDNNNDNDNNNDDLNILPYRKCCVEHKALRETTIWVVRKLKAAGITYFLSTGTALGALRHNGVIIPWDTDVDIAVYPKDGKNVEELFRGNKEHFFRRDPHRKPMFWVYHSKNGFPASGPHVEIFYDPVYTQFPHLLLPLQECLFYNVSMMCPNVKQFEEWFPSGWKVYGGGHYNGPRSCTVRMNGKAIAKRRC